MIVPPVKTAPDPVVDRLGKLLAKELLCCTLHYFASRNSGSLGAQPILDNPFNPFHHNPLIFQMSNNKKQNSKIINFKISKQKTKNTILNVKHFKMSNSQNWNFQICNFSNYTARLPFWSTKKT
jgi:hypothetical protein